MKNVKELRNELSNVFRNLKEGKIDAKTASAMNNSASKIINTIKVQLDYAGKRKEKPVIDFMKCH